MFKSVALTAILVSLFSLTVWAQSEKDTRNLRSFDAVKVSNGIVAELVKGTENKVEITTVGIEAGKVETSVVGETLEIRLARGNYRNHTVKVKVTYVEVLGIEATTNAQVTVRSTIEAGEAYLFATTSAYIEAKINTEILNLEAATNARILVSGSADQLNIKGFTNADIDGSNFNAFDVELQANTGAKISFQANSSITGSLATAAKATYSGNASEIAVRTTTGASLNRQ
ncbi:MAG: head GIN domain-containing protein [Mongoliitalea sp.]